MAEKQLTKEIAEQFLQDNDPVDLKEFTAIESLRKYQGAWLFVERPASRSDAASESLRAAPVSPKAGTTFKQAHFPKSRGKGRTN